MFARGTGGDVYPSIGVARALVRRGHAVELFANPYFEQAASDAGVAFTGLGSRQKMLAAMRNPDVWKKKTGWRTLMQYLLDAIPPIYEAIERRYEPGETLVIAPFSAFGARIANEKLGVPLVNLHVEPYIIRSLNHQHGMIVNPRYLPIVRPLRRMLLWAGDRFALDPILAPKTNAFRAELGLPPIRRICNGWFHSPDLAIGLFPDWYGRPQPDWPPQIRLTGFPLYDGAGDAELSPEVERFLSEGEPPIVFTLGTPTGQGAEFFRASAEACRLLGRRGMLVSPFPEQMPADPPPGVGVFGYVPFSKLLPRTVALVHHGGVGTIAQALRAGVPQLVRPLHFSHPDNAVRMVALGVGEMLKPKSYTPRKVAERLEHLTSSPDVARQTRRYADKVCRQDWLEDTCRLIESVSLRS